MSKNPPLKGSESGINLSLQSKIEENITKLHIPSEICLLAVSKRKPVEMIQAAYNIGVRHFGENYVQDALPKIQNLSEYNDIIWHYIGHIQSNKVSDIVSHFNVIESVDRKKIVRKIEKECQKLEKKMPILIEINIGKEDQKSGITPKDLRGFLTFCQDFSHIQVQGLMCIPPYDEDPIPYFKQMQTLFQELKGEFKLTVLSMGMSSDYKDAIMHGSTEVRIGTSIFGARD